MQEMPPRDTPPEGPQITLGNPGLTIAVDDTVSIELGVGFWPRPGSKRINLLPGSLIIIYITIRVAGEEKLLLDIS